MTQEDIRNVFQQELFKIRKPGAFMGIWQFHMAAEILKRPLGSIYPSGTNPRVRGHMNRIILLLNDSFTGKTPVYIMWTPLHIYSRPYDVKHFVPLLRKAMYAIM